MMIDRKIEQLKTSLPFIYREMAECYEGSCNELIVITCSGEHISYNTLNDTFRRLPSDPDNITAEECAKEFGERLYNKMYQEGVTQEILSERTGIHQVTISGYITGKHSPTFYNVDKIAKALGCSVDEFRYI